MGGEAGAEGDVDTTLDKAIAEEVSLYLDTAQSISQLSTNVLTEEPKGIPLDEALEGLDEEKLDAFVLTKDEVWDKERVWVGDEPRVSERPCSEGGDGAFGRAEREKETEGTVSLLIIIVFLC